MTPALAWGAAAATVDLKALAATMAVATGRDAVNVRERVLTAAPPSPVERDRFARQVDEEFRPLLSSANADARLNTAILFAQLQTLSTDAPLMAAVSNKDPAVRYWAAKGLSGSIAATIKRVPASAASVAKALAEQSKVETSGVVLQEILRALVVYESLDGVLEGLEPFTTRMQTEIPDRGDLDAVSFGLNWLQGPIKNGDAVQKRRAANVAARAASFTAQQLEVYAGFETVPPAYVTAAKALVDNAVKVLQAASGTATLRVGAVDPPAMMVVSVNALVGKPGTPGALQQAMPAIAPPPRVGGSTTNPATAPGATGTTPIPPASRPPTPATPRPPAAGPGTPAPR